MRAFKHDNPNSNTSPSRIPLPLPLDHHYINESRRPSQNDPSGPQSATPVLPGDTWARMTRNDHPRPLYDRSTSSSNASLLPTHNAQAQFRPRSAFGHREDLGRLAARQARRARRAGEAEKGDEDMTSSDELEMQDTVYSDDGLRDDEETGLTAAERDKRRSQKRKKRRMDERIAGNERGAWGGEANAADRFVFKKLLVNAVFIGLWYFFSISISLYNKWMFREDKPEDAGDGKEGLIKPSEPVFPFPLFTTCAHMLVQFSLASLVMFIFPRFQPWRTPAGGSRLPNDNERIDEQGNEKKPLMTWWFYLTRIAPCGLATGTDIGLGNMSLKFISLTFYTMCKSSVLGFVLVFAFIFRLEKPTWKLCAIIVIMTLGVIMMVAGETAFDVLGFVLVMTAAASSGFRWSLTQILLLRNRATSNPFASIFFLAPVMFIALLIIAIPVEGPFAMVAGLDRLAKAKGTLSATLILIFPGCLAFLMTASEFALLQRSSVVTLSIAGIFKEIVTITAASLAYDDKLTPINISGLLVTIATIAVYNWMKISKMRNEARMQAHAEGADYQPVLGDDGEAVNGHANGKSKDPERRDSTASLIRNSLSSGGPQSPRLASPKGENRASPSKRPGDLD